MTGTVLADIVLALYWWLIALSMVRIGLTIWFRESSRLDAAATFVLAGLVMGLAIVQTSHGDTTWPVRIMLAYIFVLTIHLCVGEIRAKRERQKRLTTPMRVVGQCGECYADDQLYIVHRLELPNGRPRLVFNTAYYWPWMFCRGCGTEERGTLSDKEEGTDDDG